MEDTISFRPMTENEYARFRERSVQDYAASCIASGDWSEEVALQNAYAQFKKHLPDGLASPHNSLLTILHNNKEIGSLWLQTRQQPLPDTLHILDIFISPRNRRQGLGKRAMDALEVMAKKQEVQALTLHVFPQNHAAQQLYRKQGFRNYPSGMVKYLAKA